MEVIAAICGLFGLALIITGCYQIGWKRGYRKGWADRSLSFSRQQSQTAYDLEEAARRPLKSRFDDGLRFFTPIHEEKKN